MTRNASGTANSNDEPGGASLESVLDGALVKLSPEGRDALVLRFFERQSYEEVGRRLGISEEAAKQRVHRGLEKLRQVLTRRGVQVSADSLQTMLGVSAVRLAPAHMAKAVL